MTGDPSQEKRRRLLQRWFQGVGARLTKGAGGGSVSGRLSTWVGIISAMIGGFLGLNTYQTDVAKKVDQRVEKSFEMVSHFNGAELAEPRLRVLSYVDAKRYCDARIISRELIDNDFVTVIDFFDLAYACVDANLCDRQTSEKFFSPYANYQWPILKTVVEELRGAEQSMRADAGFGEGMKAFAVTPSEPPPCDGNF